MLMTKFLAAPQASKAAAGTDAAAEAGWTMEERMHLIMKDGLEGASMEGLRAEIGRNYSGVQGSHFTDAKFVAAARDWHEAKALAEGGFVAKGNAGLQDRYENADKEFYAHLAPMGKDIEAKGLADQPPKTAAPKAGTAPPQSEGRPTGPGNITTGWSPRWRARPATRTSRCVWQRPAGK